MSEKCARRTWFAALILLDRFPNSRPGRILLGSSDHTLGRCRYQKILCAATSTEVSKQLNDKSVWREKDEVSSLYRLEWWRHNNACNVQCTLTPKYLFSRDRRQKCSKRKEIRIGPMGQNDDLICSLIRLSVQSKSPWSSWKRLNWRGDPLPYYIPLSSQSFDPDWTSCPRPNLHIFVSKLYLLAYFCARWLPCQTAAIRSPAIYCLPWCHLQQCERQKARSCSLIP